MSARRSIQVFNMSFLDMMTNFLGAVIILFLLAAKEMQKRPFPNVKAEAKVVYNEKTRDINGQIPAGVLSALKAGDTLLVIIDKKIYQDGKTETAPPPAPRQPAGVVLDDNQVVVTKEEKAAFEEAKKNPESPCMLFMDNVKVSACNDNNTPDNSDDDTYKVDLIVTSAGKCSSSQLWKDDKSSGVTKYGQVKTYTFKMKDGPQKITVSDFGNTAVSKVIPVNPPTPCAQKAVANPTPKKQVFPPPPGINFQIEFEEKSGQNVDLWVEKNGRYVFGNKRKDDFGTWDNDKRGFLNPGKTGLERVRQLGDPIPGTYKIYAHYRESDTAPPTIKVSLYLSSQKAQQSDKMDFNVSQTKNNPRSGGGMLLKTVTVLPDGSLKY